MPRTKTPKTSTSAVKKSVVTRKASQLKDIDAKIKNLETQIKELKDQRKEILLAENSEKLMEINDIISASGLTMSQVKAILKTQKSEPKKPRGRKKTKPSIIEEMKNDKE